MIRKTYLEKELCFSQVKQEGKGQCMPEKGQLHSIEKSRQLQCKLYLAAKKENSTFRSSCNPWQLPFRLDIYSSGHFDYVCTDSNLYPKREAIV